MGNKVFTRARLVSVCSVVPDNVVEISSYEDSYDTKTIERIMESTGVKSVHVAPVGMVVCFVQVKA